MEFTFEGLVIAVIAILPGFVATAARLVVAPDTENDAAEWVAGGIVASLALNAILLPFFAVAFLSIDLTENLGTIEHHLAEITGWGVVKYLGVLYGFAIVVGLAAGASAAYSPRELAYRLRLTPISTASNVFSDILASLTRDGGAPRPAPWIRLRRKDMLILGRLRNSSVSFDVDKSVEIYIDRVTLQCGETIQMREPYIEDRFKGMYLRILPDDLVEVLLAPPEWDPIPFA